MSIEYKNYLKSPQWKDRRMVALERAGFKCESCGIGFESAQLDVHHRTYERLGDEGPNDLVVLCRECHGRAHMRWTPPLMPPNYCESIHIKHVVNALRKALKI